MTAHRDAELLSRPAMRAIGRDHPAGPDRLLDVGVAVTQGGGYSFVILAERDDVGRKPQVGAKFLGPRAQQRFKEALRYEHALRRADIADAFVQVGDEVRELAAGERVHRHDRAVLHELLAGLVADDLLDPDAAQDLHRPLRDLCGAWMDGGAAVMLGDDDADALVREQQSHRHPDEAAAGDEDVTFVIHEPTWFRSTTRSRHS